MTKYFYKKAPEEINIESIMPVNNIVKYKVSDTYYIDNASLLRQGDPNNLIIFGSQSSDVVDQAMGRIIVFLNDPEKQVFDIENELGDLSND